MIRSELSKKNKYYISKYRYYELKYFCLQYGTWKQAYKSLNGLSKQHFSDISNSSISDPTERCVENKLYFRKLMDLVEDSAKLTDPFLWELILIGVTTTFSYDKLKARLEIPCSKSYYYNLYHKFFYLLNKQKLHSVL